MSHLKMHHRLEDGSGLSNKRQYVEVTGRKRILRRLPVGIIHRLRWQVSGLLRVFVCP